MTWIRIKSQKLRLCQSLHQLQQPHSQVYQLQQIIDVSVGLMAF